MSRTYWRTLALISSWGMSGMEAFAARSASLGSLKSGHAVLGMAVNATTCSFREPTLRVSCSQRRTISVGERWAPRSSMRLLNDFNSGKAPEGCRSRPDRHRMAMTVRASGP